MVCLAVQTLVNRIRNDEILRTLRLTPSTPMIAPATALELKAAKEASEEQAVQVVIEEGKTGGVVKRSNICTLGYYIQNFL